MMKKKYPVHKKMSIFIVVILSISLIPIGCHFANIHKYGILFLHIDSAVAEDKKTEKDKNNKDKNNTKGSETKKQPCPKCPKCPDPAKVVLKGLAERKAAVDKAEESLKKERKSLNEFKDDLDEKLDRLTKLKKQIEKDIADLTKKKTAAEQKKQAAFEAKMDRLVKMYSGMKPKNAAKIVDKLDLEVAKKIFSRMRETSASQILAYVDSEKAAKISERIAYKQP